MLDIILSRLLPWSPLMLTCPHLGLFSLWFFPPKRVNFIYFADFAFLMVIIMERKAVQESYSDLYFVNHHTSESSNKLSHLRIRLIVKPTNSEVWWPECFPLHHISCLYFLFLSMSSSQAHASTDHFFSSFFFTGFLWEFAWWVPVMSTHLIREFKQQWPTYYSDG